jgi:hypothetical protein
MRRHEVIYEELGRLAGRRAAYEYCKTLIKFIVSNDPQLSQHLTYRHIGDIVYADPRSEELQMAVTLLCSRFKAMSFKMEFFDETGEAFRLNDEEVSHFLRTGELAHPHTGQLVDKPEGNLVPYFVGCRAELMRESR